MAFAAVLGANTASLAAMRESVPVEAWLLLLGNLFWVLAYDTEYAMVDRDDDLRIGIRTSAITLGRFDVAAVLLSYALYLGIWTTLLLHQGLASLVVWVAAAAGMAQVFWHGWLIRRRERDGCFAAFRANHWLGFTLFAGVVLASLLR